MDKIKPTFSKGGKLGFLESTFEAFETFLFVPNTTTVKGAHIRDCNDMKRTMIMVVLALMPAFLFGCWWTGAQVGLEGFRAFIYGLVRVLPMVCVSYIVGLAIEFYFAQVRGHEVNEGFLVTGLLIPMIFPVSTPLWMVALSTAFAVIFGKEVFGGTGMNVFNPALLARAFAFFAYTPSMSGEAVWYSNWTMMGAHVDGVTGATALEQLASTGTMTYSPLDAFLGMIPGSFGETSTLAILIGAAILLWTGIASWRTMISVFVGGLAIGLLFNWIGGTADIEALRATKELAEENKSLIAMLTYMKDVPAWWHLIVGGFAFGAVFMATDPVTSAQTNKGKYIVGFMTGALAVLIRVVNPAYPEGMMLSILFMNALAPLVDYFVVEANISRRKKRVKLAK
ncbi:NADH:ubiquinone reductase (Na(+)-transporting) subunit B [Alistipes sp. An66]|uniref:NADH:ubiquinone reductase (Na(+)-transporting) subunit B n=1 Tax=Alistipes sp. An66 TaxID=1965650 RepID=UPI000B39BB82|nr:NADH:ubiquinone reductase (Na(+)-transporting) subunit B [Alistipes sp. An66]OUN59670.1 NADH:ubiquinone reductase (Na(+)-transporting) subunit B [Alistipes sp. An66]